ncbi:MAG: SGNH/GDSL hydrolase family protein [Faecalimonas sp.]|nr:SGNH/GDSL hydrolase family protein [Faecalimonas sp.]
MFNMEIEKYKKLNSIAESFGTVILGSGEDILIPISELANSFNIGSKFYNRSSQNLIITEAIHYYDSIVKPLNPERIILHIGSADIDFFRDNTPQFDRAYQSLIEHIREDNAKCNIGIISLCNPNDNDIISELNNHLRIIAQSQRCEFEDIGTPRVWNPIETKSTISFASSMGLSLKTSNQKSLYDLAKIFFAYN